MVLGTGTTGSSSVNWIPSGKHRRYPKVVELCGGCSNPMWQHGLPVEHLLDPPKNCKLADWNGPKCLELSTIPGTSMEVEKTPFIEDNGSHCGTFVEGFMSRGWRRSVVSGRFRFAR